MEQIRLNKFIAQQLNLGRRAADDLITQGKVKLNGDLPQLGARVKAGDQVVVNGTRLQTGAPDFLYVLFNKPTGYVCSRRQQGDTPTIYSILPPAYQHLKPVGRLDKDSSGLLVLTNDGDFAHRMTHPSFIKTKVYQVMLDQPLQPLHHQMIADHGVLLPDGPSKFQLTRQEDGDPFRWIVTMHEGRNRQIRRTFDALGYRVITLNRVQFGPFTLTQLDGAQFKEVTDRALLD